MLRKITLVFLIGSFLGCTHTNTPEAPLAHLVFIWLKEPANQQHRQQVISASKQLAAIDGVVRVKVGQSIASDRDVVDDSYDVGLYVEFASMQALKNYATDPIHQNLLKEHLLPITDRYLVYDFEVDR